MKVVFPREADKVILAEEVKELMTFEDRRDNEQNERTAQFYEFYIDELEAGVKGYIYIKTIFQLMYFSFMHLTIILRNINIFVVCYNQIPMQNLMLSTLMNPMFQL